jgi:hypothetical protein
MFVALTRDGQEAVVTVELDDPHPGDVSPYPQFLRVIPPGLEVEQTRKVEFVWIDHNLLQARFLLDGEGIFFTTVVTGESSSFPGPSIALPYSSEFFPRDGLPTGRETLQGIARISGGQELTNVLAVLEPANRPRSPKMVSLLPWLLGIVIGLLVIEIAGRRLSLWIAIQQSWQSRKQTVTEPAVSKEPDTRPGWLPKWKLSWKRKRDPQASASTPAAKAPQSDSPQSAEPEKKAVVAPSMNRLLEEAKLRAERRRNK